jgi:hypothetical protein
MTSARTFPKVILNASEIVKESSSSNSIKPDITNMPRRTDENTSRLELTDALIALDTGEASIALDMPEANIALDMPEPNIALDIIVRRFIKSHPAPESR